MAENAPPIRKTPVEAPAGDDVLALAAKGQGGMTQGQPQGGQQNPVMVARDMVGKLIAVKHAVGVLGQTFPQLAPIMQEFMPQIDSFLQKLSTAGKAPGTPPQGTPPPGGPPPPGATAGAVGTPPPPEGM
jgi:hypothetical protein